MRTGLCLIILVGLIGNPSLSIADEKAAVSSLLEFSLRGTDGTLVTITPSAEEQWTVVCFLGAECPVARLYGSRLQQLADELSDEGVRFVGVGSNHQDSVDDLRRYASTTKLRIPLVKDFGNLVADRFGAKRTPEVFVLDKDLRVRYRGRIDDEFQPGVARSEASRHYLRNALEELLSGRPVSVPETEAVGCLIGRVKTGEPTTEITYANEVSRVLRRHCVECHRPGEIGPFSLTDYDEVIGWGPMMLEVIDEGRMPPWHADRGVGSFSNAREMPERDRELLREWVNGGMPFGDAENLPEPLPEKTGVWQLARKPDLVLPMADRPFQVPADEIVEYQYYVVDPGFEEDTWVVGAQVLPGNRSVVHHCLVFIRPPDGFDSRGIGWLTAYVPGQRNSAFPEGYARRVPAGSRLVFQMHYTPTGTPQEDLTQLGLLIGNEREITHELFTLTAINHDFEIPPQAADHPVRASRGQLPDRGELLAAAPHMHVRGKSFDLFAERNDERTKLLSIPHYDFNWQHVYAFENPIPLESIDRLSFEARFDNSKENPANPDPSAYVTWGDQTFEEMAIGFFELAVPRSTGDEERLKDSVAAKPAEPESKAAAENYARDYFQRFDRNGDGAIVEEELPESIRRFGFRSLDSDADGQIVREEIVRAFQRRRRP